jgi:hypothetical protein
MYVPSKLTVRGDASATFNNIAAAESLFRIGIASGLVCYTFFLLLPLALYKLLKEVNKTHAVLMVMFAAASVPISFVNMLNKFAVLSLMRSAGHLKVFDTAQLQAQAMLYLDLYDWGNVVAQVFWGLWLFPFGYLVFKSGFMPRILGIFLMAGCAGDLVDSFGSILFKGYGDAGISAYASLPGGLGEIGTCLWLLIMGVKPGHNQAM